MLNWRVKMMKLITVIFCLSSAVSNVLAAMANESEMATLEFHGIEVEPYKMDGKRLDKYNHTIKVKPGKHIVMVYLDWPGRGRSSETKSACFIAKAGKQYLMGADTDDERIYQSDWSPYITETSAHSVFINFLSLGFARKAQTCD